MHLTSPSFFFIGQRTIKTACGKRVPMSQARSIGPIDCPSCQQHARDSINLTRRCATESPYIRVEFDRMGFCSAAIAVTS